MPRARSPRSTQPDRKSECESYFGARSCLSFAVIAALGTGGAAVAQQPIEDVTVTGTRVRQTDGMATPVPVTVVTPDELSTFEPGGTIAEQLDA